MTGSMSASCPFAHQGGKLAPEAIGPDWLTLQKKPPPRPITPLRGMGQSGYQRYGYGNNLNDWLK